MRFLGEVLHHIIRIRIFLMLRSNRLSVAALLCTLNLLMRALPDTFPCFLGFRGAGNFDGIQAYNAFAHEQVGGWFQTVVTAGNYHEVNLRDKIVIVTMIERLRRNGKLNKDDFAHLPFDDLRIQ